MIYGIYFITCLAIALLPFRIKNIITMAAIKKESKKASKNDKWLYDIILK